MNTIEDIIDEETEDLNDVNPRLWIRQNKYKRTLKENEELIDVFIEKLSKNEHPIVAIDVGFDELVDPIVETLQERFKDFHYTDRTDLRNGVEPLSEILVFSERKRLFNKVKSARAKQQGIILIYHTVNAGSELEKIFRKFNIVSEW